MAYEKPELTRFGSLRDLTLVGHRSCYHWFDGKDGHGPWFDWDNEPSSGWDRS